MKRLILFFILLSQSLCFSASTVSDNYSNFASGEISPKTWGRDDLPLYRTALERCENFLVETQGPLRFRNGLGYVHHTRNNQVAYLTPFQFSDSQAYVLEFTEKKIRIYRDTSGVITFTALNITAATAANPCVVTSNAHGYSNGDEVYIEGVVGMTQLNGRFFTVAGVTANTFQLTDVDGANVNSTAYTAYSSGGTVAKVVEIRTPYLVGDLTELSFAQNADTMYLVHRDYLPLKLTRTGHTAWTLKTFVRTADPLMTFAATQNITAITQASPGVITIAGHGYSTGDVLQLASIGGMTELNSQQFYIDVINANTFSLRYLDGTALSTAALTAYTAGGTAAKATLYLPQAVAFYEGRVVYGGASANPETFYGSRSPNPTTGATRYDDFTTGTDADHAFAYTQAPSASGKVDVIQWFFANLKFLVAGNFGGTNRIDGGSDDAAITPTSIRVRPLDSLGCKKLSPVSAGNGDMIYVQRGGLAVRSLEFDFNIDSYVAVDRNLVADHLTLGGVRQLAYQRGNPELLWVATEDGYLRALTFKDKSDVSGWSRQTPGGYLVNVLSAAVLPRSEAYDQLWIVVEREIDGHTRRYVEYMADQVAFHPNEDFYTGDEADDESRAANVRWEAQKTSVHVDSFITFNGSDRGTAAGATLTPAAVSGASVVFTASAAVFTAADVGNQLWIKYVDGDERGRATITTFTDTTHVTCEITSTFGDTSAIPAGEWFITASSLSGLDHLEGEAVQPVCDGRAHPVETVTNGAVTLDYEASVIHLGLPYTGFVKTLDLEPVNAGGQTQGRQKALAALRLYVVNTVGMQTGPELYNIGRVIFQSTADVVGRPPPLFTGVKAPVVPGGWAETRHLYFLQDRPYPCTLVRYSLDYLVETPSE